MSENFEQSRAENQKKWEKEAKDRNAMPPVLKSPGEKEVSAMDMARAEAIRENERYNDMRTTKGQKAEEIIGNLPFSEDDDIQGIWRASGAMRRTGLSGEELFASSRAQEAAKESLSFLLDDKHHIDDAVLILQDLEVTDDILSSPEVQEAAKQKIIRGLQNKGSESYWDAIEAAQRFKVSKEILSSPEIQQLARDTVNTAKFSENWTREDFDHDVVPKLKAIFDI